MKTIDEKKFRFKFRNFLGRGKEKVKNEKALMKFTLSAGKSSSDFVDLGRKVAIRNRDFSAGKEIRHS
jgi:hypothetical protein